MDFLKERDGLIFKGNIRDVNYVDITDDSNSAFHLFKIIKFRDSDDLTVDDFMICYKPISGQDLKVKILKTKDYSDVMVVLNETSVSKVLNIPEIVRPEAAAVVAMTQHCIGRMISRAFSSMTWKRILPNTLVKTQNDAQRVISIIRRLFTKNLIRGHNFIRRYPLISEFRFRTYGQLFLIMFLIRYRKYENVSRNLRLMIFYLIKFSGDSNEEILSNIYSWIVNDLCQSCAEKTLIDSFSVTPLYEEGNLCLDKNRLIWFDDISAQYVIKDHDGDTRCSSVFILKRLEHSEFFLKNRTSSVTLNYNSDPATPGFFQFKMDYHSGVVLMRSINIAVRALRAAFYSNDNSIIINELFKLDGMENNESEEMFAVLINIARFSPMLVYLCENLVAMFYYLGITQFQKSNFIINADCDFYDVSVKFLISVPSNYPVIRLIRENTNDWNFINHYSKAGDRIMLKRNLYSAIPRNR